MAPNHAAHIAAADAHAAALRAPSPAATRRAQAASAALSGPGCAAYVWADIAAEYAHAGMPRQAARAHERARRAHLRQTR